MALPHGAVDWSAVCDCGISCSYSLTFLSIGGMTYIYVNLVLSTFYTTVLIRSTVAQW